MQKVPGLKEELSKIAQKIENLIDEGETLRELLRSTTSGDNSKSSQEQTTGSGSQSTTTSKPPIEVFGRDEDAKKIIRMLHDTAADHFAIVIHGVAGSGKSTLAQYVCESEKKKFELFMWIKVTENFTVDALYKEMLEKVPGKKMDGVSNLDYLETELQERLEGKRLLLVLDDVRYSSESVTKQDNVKKLLSTFMEADKGSRVLITSRTTDAAKLLDVAHHLEPISDMNEEEFSKMFMHYALGSLGNSMVTDQTPRSKFETIGKEIVALLPRSPLAARTVAGQLREKPLKFWINTKQKEKHHLLKDTMGALWWSYHQLEEHARRCFAYCSMFPRRYELKRDELVQMWMAQGFGDTSENSDIEFAADKCFDVLLSTSFIQLKPKTDDHQECYTVHDLLHDLAEIVAGSDCFRTEKGTVDQKIPQDVRHLFIDSDNLGELMEQIVKLDTLRTLVIPVSARQITEKEFQRMLKHLKKLRFVHVFLKAKKEEKYVIPACIGELKHLRYLALIGVGPIEVPSAFTKLYHLQGFEVSFGTSVFCPHNEIADLENLRRIGGLRLDIPDIGRMKWLQTLGAFTVKEEKGYEITQLEKLNNIHGQLTIHGLGNIKSNEEARRANLSNKLHVTYLVLNWKSNDETESSSRKKQKTTVAPLKPEEILEALRPPALLVQLWIENYGGSTFPNWLSGEDGTNLKHLESLSLYNCHGSGSLFKFSKPLPELHSLDIYTCSWNALPDNIEQLASLKKLTIRRCRNIKSLPGLPSSLKILKITVCKNVKELPELPPSLEELQCEQYLVDSYPDKEAIARIKKKSFL